MNKMEKTQIKKLFFLLGLLFLNQCINAEEIDPIQIKTNSLLNNTFLKLNEDKNTNRNTNISNSNKQIKSIYQTMKPPQFSIKENKKIHIYTRESYKIIEDNYVMKTPSQWKTILIKTKNIWE
jgi:hypothetical protein